MSLSSRADWRSRIFTFACAALVAGSVVYWALPWTAPASSVPLVAVDVQDSAGMADPAAVARALGATDAPAAQPAPALEASRFALVGVVAGAHQDGAALIAVDGKAAKPFAVGARVGDAWVLRSVQPRQAVLVPAVAGNAGAPSDAAELVLLLPVKGKNSP